MLSHLQMSQSNLRKIKLKMQLCMQILEYQAVDSQMFWLVQRTYVQLCFCWDKMDRVVSGRIKDDVELFCHGGHFTFSESSSAMCLETIELKTTGVQRMK